MGKNDTAWEGLFEKYRILDKIEREGQYIITADEIRKFREPRLMTKFDHKINLPAIFQNNGLSILPITRGEYYTDAGRYLGLIEKGVNEDNEIYFFLSEQGRYIMTLDYRSRQLAIAKQILEHKVFNETLRIHLNCGEMPDRTTIMQIMKRSNLFNVKADSTYYRRTFTVIGWVNWILDTIDE